MKTKARLVTVSYPTSDPDKAAAFYGDLLGVELARSLTDQMVSLHAWGSAGVQLTLNPRRAHEQNAICHFAVDNVDAMSKDLQNHGGKVIAGPFQLPIARETMQQLAASYKKFGGTGEVGHSLGTEIIMQDPDGNLVGLIQLEPFAHHAFKTGELSEEDLEEHTESVRTGKILASSKPR